MILSYHGAYLNRKDWNMGDAISYTYSGALQIPNKRIPWVLESLPWCCNWAKIFLKN